MKDGISEEGAVSEEGGVTVFPASNRAAHHLGLLLRIAGERNVALELGEAQIVTHFFFDEMRELLIAAHGEMHAVIGTQPLDLTFHVRAIGAVAAGIVGEAAPGVDKLGAVDESLLAEHIVEELCIVASD